MSAAGPPAGAAAAGAPEVIVTNFNRNYTGVSSTAAAVVRKLVRHVDLRLCGVALPACPEPVGRLTAIRLSRFPPPDRPAVIWHVRRNSEMRLALACRDLLRLPIRIVFTSAAQRRHSALPRWLIARMDAVIATSEAAAGHVPRVAAIVPHGVDTQVFAPAPDREAAWRASGFPGRHGIVCVGRLRPEKGTDIFVRAMIEVLGSRSDTVAVAIGAIKPADRGFVDELKREVAAAGLSDRILFPGELPSARLARVLPGATLLVAAPRYEGYGMTVLEAMAAGVPFVATDTGVYAQLAGEGTAGRIVPVGDAAALAAATGSMLDDPRGFAETARAARDRAVEHHSVDVEAERIAEVYERLWRDKPVRR